LTPPRKADPTPHAGNDTPAAFVGTGGRIRSDHMVAFNRNPWSQSPESAQAQATIAGQLQIITRNGKSAETLSRLKEAEAAFAEVYAEIIDAPLKRGQRSQSGADNDRQGEVANEA